MKERKGRQYLTFDEMESWFCNHHEEFEKDVERKATLRAVVDYLVTLGKVLRFERVEQLRDFVFPDPEWLIMLIKNVVHHDLCSHLQYKEDFKICNMDAVNFEIEKKELIEHGLLSESLLRCIWYDAVPEESDFKKLAPLLYYFDVGYQMTVKEAENEGKEIGKRYILIPALMPKARPSVLDEKWPENTPEDYFEAKSVYKFCSRVPVGLFERQMVRSHQGSDYMFHWKEGFFGVYDMEEADEVKFCVTKHSFPTDTIEFTARIGKSGQIKTLWKAVIRLHEIFAKMVRELWPELRYSIYNKCHQCNECHHEMDFEMLLKAPNSYNKTVVCKAQDVPVKVRSVFPPTGISLVSFL